MRGPCISCSPRSAARGSSVRHASFPLEPSTGRLVRSERACFPVSWAGPDDELVERRGPVTHNERGAVTHNGGSKRGRRMHGSMYVSGTYSCEKGG
jgi:hypothetical protein